MTLYLKYRPQTIDELDLESVRITLINIINSKTIPHAFLFSGPKGTGKTSAARILAKVVNCENLKKNGEPCNKCSSCLSIMSGSNIDVIELDAASNRGIDDIRSLKEGIYLAPAAAKRKVYIIDEAHMLTLEAANAFLKTLEEPPEHAVFILATTNPEKLPATVVSRLTQVIFTKANEKDIARQLTRVTKGEKIKIESKAISRIAKLADGSFRDAVKMLENLSFKTKNIRLEDIGDSSDSVNEFFSILEKKDVKAGLEFIERVVKKGTIIKSFTDDVLEKIHQEILENSGEADDLIHLFNLINETKGFTGPIAQLPLEIAIIKYCLPADATPQASQAGGVPSIVREEKKKDPIKTLDESIWQNILQEIHTKNISVEALLRSAKPVDYNDKKLMIGVYYQFHKDKLEDAKNVKILEDVCKKVINIDSIKISFKLIKKISPADERDKPAKNESLTTKVDKDIIDAAKEIFG